MPLHACQVAHRDRCNNARAEPPLALNLFDLGKSRADTYDARTRQMLDTNAIDLLTYVFDTLLGTATTPNTRNNVTA